MALDPEFKKHMHELMVEVYEKTIDETEQHKREVLFKARSTHNAAATPIAYKDAALYSTEFRISRTIEKYIEAVVIWGYSIDAAFEADMIKEFWSLTAGPNQIQFPPAIKGQQVQAVQGSYARERQRLAARLVREGTNRLRELKMKITVKPQPNHSTIIQGDQFNNYGVAGAIGQNAVGTVNTFNQCWQRIEPNVDLAKLAIELGTLRSELVKSAVAPEDFVQVGVLAQAEGEAKSSNGPGVMKTLSSAARAVLETAERIGTDIAAKVIVEAAKGY